MGNTRLATITITVQDIGRTTNFYRDVVGLQSYSYFCVGGAKAFFQCGEILLCIREAHGNESGYRACLSFRVEDFRERMQSIKDKGLQVVREEPSSASLRDPDGNWITLTGD